MSLQCDILRTEIAKLKAERMTEQTAEKLARYWCAMQALQDEPAAPAAAMAMSVQQEALEPVTEGTGAFHDAVRGKPPADVYNVLEDHFRSLAMVAPRQYAAVMAALDKL